MQWDIDAEYNALMDQLQAAVAEDGLYSARAGALRLRIEALLRERMSLATQRLLPGQRTGPDALH